MEKLPGRVDVWIKRSALLSIVGASMLYGASKLNDFNFFEGVGAPGMPDIPLDLEPSPPVVDAGVDYEFVQVEEEFDIRCRARIGVAVGVRGFMNGPVGDGKVNKKIFGDFMPCSDSMPGTARLIPNQLTGEIEVVEISYLPLEPTQGRVDFEDGRNCADINADDSLEQAKAKIIEREEAIKNGERPDCDDGFLVTQLGGSSDLAEVINLSHAAAQIAIEYIDPDVYSDINSRNLEDLIEHYRSLYPNADIRVDTKEDAEYLEYLEQKINEYKVLAEAQKDENGSPVFETVQIEKIDSEECNSEGAESLSECNVLTAYGYDGGSVRITLSDIQAEAYFEGETEFEVTNSRKIPSQLGPVNVDSTYMNSPFMDDFIPTTTILGPVGVNPEETNQLTDEFFNLND